MRNSNYFKIIIAALFFLAPVFSFAQNISSSITITLSTENPQPNQSISASVSALSFNIDLAKIVWSLDGKVIKSGDGEKNVSFSAPAAGKSASLSASVTPQGGALITQSVEISSGGSVDLIWESIDGYTPPFYRGKTLPIKQSTIKVVAMPVVKNTSGLLAKPSDFVYTWRKDGTNVGGQSGLGKNSIVFGNQILDNSNRVEVSATNGAKVVTNSISVTPFTPDILFYLENDKTGIEYQNTVVDNDLLSGTRISIVTEPYFLLKNFRSNTDATIDWKVNGQKVVSPNKGKLTLNTSGQKGLFSIITSYNEPKRLFRSFNETLRVNIK